MSFCGENYSNALSELHYLQLMKLDNYTTLMWNKQPGVLVQTKQEHIKVYQFLHAGGCLVIVAQW